MLFSCFLLSLAISFTWCESAGTDFPSDAILSTVRMDLNFIRIIIIILFHAVWFVQAQLIVKYGYRQQTHHVTTNDGYILELHRIYTAGGQPVILMHGLLDSSATWVLSGPKTGLGLKYTNIIGSGVFLCDVCFIFLAYILSDLGYDVWMGNARGNIYSKNHKRYRANGTRHERKMFWNFSFHEIGIIDLPAIIDYVETQTHFSKLHYIGHSQGVTAFFVMTSERPEYNEKILLMTALAPPVYMSNVGDRITQAFVKYLTSIEVCWMLAIHHRFHLCNETIVMEYNFQILYDLLGVYSYSPEVDELLSLTTNALCSIGFNSNTLCSNNFAPLIGNLTNHINAVN